MYLPDQGVEPVLYIRPTSFDFGFYVQIPKQQSSNNTTTFLKRVGSWFNIYKVQEFPGLNERHYYGRGTLSVGNQTWWISEGIYMEKTSQPPSYGIYLKGKP